jgi:spore maturation protein CgeB
VFAPGEEIVIARHARDVLELLEETTPEDAVRLGRAARRRVLAEHTADRRADQLHELTSGVLAR